VSRVPADQGWAAFFGPVCGSALPTAKATRVIALAAAVMFVAMPAAAFEMSVVEGTCSSVVAVGASAVANQCDGKAINMVVRTDRLREIWTFSHGQVTMAFSGWADRETKPSADTVILPVDTVRVIGRHLANRDTKGAGVCRYGNPYKGPTTITCSIDVNGNPAAVAFRTSGARPVSISAPD
jgi:hypothetical protein